MEQPPVYVTRTFLPPREEYLHWLDQAYSTHVLTNNGPIHRLLEETLRARFEVPHLKLMANGTLALQLALRALKVRGQVITTPFSYVATTSAILWEGCEPVFVDIDPETCCIDPALIEAAITPDTSAILATHVYGIPCDVEAIDAIARKYGLKVIYDAAHAFDVGVAGRSVLAYGDASTLSFHATKLFHTVEGGAVVLHRKDHDHDIRLLRSFGHIGDEHFTLGMNAKMSELHAAMGMAVLPYLPACIADRKRLYDTYTGLFAGTPVKVLPEFPGTVHNYAYFPVFLKDGATRERVQAALVAHGINPRRYFYPSLNRLPYVDQVAMPVSEHMAETVLSLPFYPGLPDHIPRKIVDLMIPCL
ncbi:MAG: DegT/DnrJ/EryC1/StrS family aminotransferase [Flavobacteriales bacterium]|nr:DegT/DnrJ/EryC1/StrS family aminotransferase [Flavobacteriales bacterium]